MNPRKPVLVRITNNLGLGGVQRRLRDLLPRLAEHFAVHVITYKDRGVFFEELRDHGVTPHFLPRRFPAVARLAAFLGRLEPTIVHTHSYGGNVLGLPAARLVGAPVRVGHVHLAHLHWYAASPWRRRLQARKEALVHRLASHAVCCVSEEARQHFLAGTGLAPSRVVVLENGIRRPPEHVTPMSRAALGVPPGAVVLGMAGRITRTKGFAQGISWMAQTPPHVHLVVAGPGDTTALERHAHALGLHGRVHFLGPLTDMPAFYAALDLLLFPSPPGVEGMPGIVLEALGMGCAVLAQESGPLREMAPVAPRLHFFRPELPAAAQMEAAMASPAADLAPFFARFSLEAMVERTLHLYETLLRQGRP